MRLAAVPMLGFQPLSLKESEDTTSSSLGGSKQIEQAEKGMFIGIISLTFGKPITKIGFGNSNSFCSAVSNQVFFSFIFCSLLEVRPRRFRP